MAEFNAGSIEAKLEVDKDPFERGLAEAEAEAEAFAHDPIRKKIELDSSDADAVGASSGNLLGITSRSILTGGTGIAVAIAGFSPVIDAFTGAILGLTSALSVAGTGLGAFGLSAFGNLTKITDAYDNIKKAQQELADASTPDQIKKANQDIADAEKGLTPPLQAAISAWGHLQDSLAKFDTDTAPKVLGVFDKLFDIAGQFLPKLAPIANATADALQTVLGPLQDLLSGSGMTGFLALVKNQIGPVISTLATDTFTFVNSLLTMFTKLAPLIGPSMGVLTSMVQGFSEAVSSPAFQTFIKTIESDIPMIAPLLNSVFQGIGDIMVAVLPAVPGFMVLLSGIVRFVDELATGGTLGALAQAVGALFEGITPLLDPLAKLINAIATPAFTLIADVFVALAPAVQQIADGLSQNMPALSKAFDDLLTGLTPLLPPLTNFTILLVQSLLPYLPDIVELMQNFSDIIIALSPFLVTFIQGQTDLMSAIQPVVQAVLKFVLGILDAITNVKNIKQVFSDVVQWGKDFINFWDDVGHAISGAFKDVIGFFDTVGHDIASAFTTAVSSVVSWFGNLPGYLAAPFEAIGRSIISPIVDAVTKAGSAVIDWFTKLPGEVGRAILAGVTALGNAGEQMISSFFDHVKKAWGLINYWFYGLPDAIAQDILQGLEKMEEVGEDIVNRIWTGLQRIWNKLVVPFFDAIGDFFERGFDRSLSWLVDGGSKVIQGLWNGIQAVWNRVVWPFLSGIQSVVTGLFRTALNWLTGSGSGIMSGLWNGIAGVWNRQIWPFISSVGRQIINAFSTAGSWLVNAGSAIMHGVLTGLTTAWTDVTNWFSGRYDYFIHVMDGAKNWLFNAGWAVIQGMWDGIKAAWNAMTSWISDAASHLPRFIKGPLGISSPSTVMYDEVGQWIPKGIAQGIEDNWDSVTNALGKMPITVPMSVSGRAGSLSSGGVNVAAARGPAVVIQSATFQDPTDITTLMNQADFYIAQGRLTA